MEPLLSIITPCYNSFHLMKKSIDRFIEWNDHRLEWIIIDDQSKDDSYFRLLNFQKKNKNLNISVYQNNKNVGPGESRNTGIKVSTGKYIVFLDADDFFEKDFLNKIWPILERRYDCIIFDVSLYYNNQCKYYWPLFRNGQQEGIVKTTDAIVHLNGTTWGKIYLKEIITNNNIEFLQQRICEDIPFTKVTISYCKNIVYIKDALYNYVQQNHSLTHQESVDFTNAKNAFAYVEHSIGDRFPNELEALFIQMYLYSITLQMYGKVNKSEYRKLLEKTELLYPNYYHNCYLKILTPQIRVVIFFVQHRIYAGIKLMKWLQIKRASMLYRAK